MITINKNETRGAIIGYNNLLTSSNITTGDKALVPNTFERYTQASGAMSVRWRLTVNADVNYIGIAAHNLIGETILISTSNADLGTHTDLESITFVDNNPVMITFDSRDVKEILFSGTMSKDIEIGVIYCGAYLQMPVPIYGGHSPLILGDEIKYQSKLSDSGQFLGRNIIRKGTSSNFSWQHLDDDFVRNDFLDFKKSAQTKPFFIKWRPDFYPKEVSFAYADSQISLSNMGGGHRLMSATMSVRAHSDL